MRNCGYDDQALFEYLDGEATARRRSFEAHLELCAPCAREVASYRGLLTDLDSLPPLEPRPGFDEAILASVVGPRSVPEGGSHVRRLLKPARIGRVGSGRVGRPIGLQPARGWAEGWGRRWPIYAGGFAVLLLGGLTAIMLYAGSVGGWKKLGGWIAAQVTRLGVDALSDGVQQLLSAIQVSDVFMKTSATLRPVFRSASLVADAIGPEFWLITTALSLLAFLGAVRLAAGSAAEREVGRVYLLA